MQEFYRPFVAETRAKITHINHNIILVYFTVCVSSLVRQNCLVLFWFPHWPLYMEGKERLKNEAVHSREVGNRLN